MNYCFVNLYLLVTKVFFMFIKLIRIHGGGGGGWLIRVFFYVYIVYIIVDLYSNQACLL